MYKVEKILDKKISEGEVRYLIKWQGWSTKESTWEPLDNLSSILTMVNEFEVGKTGKTSTTRGSKKVEEKKRELSEKSSDKNSEACSEEKTTESARSPKEKPSKPSEIIDLDNLSQTEFLKKKRAVKKLKQRDFAKALAEAKPFKPHKKEDHKPHKKEDHKPKKKENVGKIEKRAKAVDKADNSSNSSSSSKPEKTDSPAPEKEKNSEKQPLSDAGNLDCDIPSKIVSARMSVEGEVLCVMQWKKRYDGSVPENSVVSNKVLKSSHPGLLLDYYESRLRDNRSQK